MKVCFSFLDRNYNIRFYRLKFLVGCIINCGSGKHRKVELYLQSSSNLPGV
jgi:hypothetical protein